MIADQTTELFPARLAEALRAAGMSGNRLAKLMETTPATVYAWRDGLQEPRLRKIPKLCLVLGVQPAWLLGMSLKGGPRVQPGKRTERPSRYGPRGQACPLGGTRHGTIPSDPSRARVDGRPLVRP